MFKAELHCLYGHFRKQTGRDDIYNTIQYNGFLRMETQLNMKLQMNYLQKDTLSTLAEVLACN